MSLNLPYSRWLLILLALSAAFALGVWSVAALTPAQPSAVSFGTGFTYQGFLRDSEGAPLTNSCDFTFRLYDELSGGSQVGSDDAVNGVAVSNGLFTVVINENNDFGSAAANGGGRYLETAVQCSGDANPTTLSPRQPINPVPYARFAERFAGYENLIVVAKAGGDFTSVGQAVDAIGVDSAYPAASAGNRYLVYVAPGVYQDEKVVMKEFVDIEGAGQGVTVITANGGSTAAIDPASATLVGAANAELRHLTVENISSAANNWAFAIYTAANTRFTHITARASGGSNPRGMVAHAGGVPALRDVALSASGGSVSNTALDVFQAAVLADGLFVNASGGTNAHGLYINSASQLVKMENVTAFASGGSSQTNGLYVNSSLVNLTAYDTTVSSNDGLVTGAFCLSTGATKSRLEAREVAVQGTKEGSTSSIRGILASNCTLTLYDATVDVAAPSAVYGLYYTASDETVREIDVNQLDVQAHSSANVVSGIYMNSSNAGSATNGRMNDVTIRASGQLTSSNSRGVYHRAAGLVQYQDLAIDITGQANFLYGVQAWNGTPYFQNVLIAAYGDAQTTVFGIEYLNDVTGGSVDNAQLLAQNTRSGSGDAVGLKSSAPQSFNFNNVSVNVYAPTRAWGYDFIGGGDISASDIQALVEGNADGTTVSGMRCLSSTADIHNARLTAQTSPADASSPSVFGVDAFNCALTLSGSQVRVRDVTGTRVGLQADASDGAATYFVRDSYLRGVSAALLTDGFAEVVVVETQLDGGVTASLSANDTTVCTAVTHGTNTSFSFTPGPVSPCP